MKNALVIAAREFEEKRFVAYAAVAFAVLNPLILGLIPMTHANSPRDAIALVSLILAAGFTTGLAVISGASFVGRDLSDGRMSFYFSRPVASTSIWFGKLTAGLVMIVGCFGVIIAPAWLATSKSWQSFWTLTLGESSLYVLLTALALFLIAHVIGTFARSRSPLIAADFAVAVLCGVAIWFLVLPLTRGGASVLISKLLVALTATLIVAIVGGGAWQLARGRVDRRRNHFALSQFIWIVMAAALLIAAGYVGWVVSTKPGDVTNMTFESHAPGGPFITIAGKAPGRGDYTAAWVLNTDDGRNLRVDAHAVWGVRYTRDGRSVIWPDAAVNTSELLRYTRGDAAPVSTGLTGSGLFGAFYFASDDGGRIARIDRGILSIYDVSQKRSIASVRVPQDGRLYYQGYFLSPDLFRLYVHAPDSLSIYELDTRVRGLQSTGGIRDGGFVNSRINPTVARMLVRRHGVDGITLNDARTGAVIKQVIQGTSVLMTRFLRDGRIVIVDGQPSKAGSAAISDVINPTLHIFTAEGILQHDLRLDGALSDLNFIGDDGTRLVLSTTKPDGSRRTFVAVNLDRGVIERTEPRVGGRTMSSSYWGDDRPPIQPLREVFYGDSAGHIVGWSPATGAKRMVTGG